MPHRYCVNHFLRDLAKPMLEADSHAKVQMRSKVRGLRGIEREILQQRRSTAVEAAAAPVTTEAAVAPVTSEAAVAAATAESGVAASVADRAVAPTSTSAACAAPPVAERSDVVLDYCSVVRGILNDDQGGPLHPPGLRMAEALD